jgi:putative endonuclease
MGRVYMVYILASRKNGTLYVGVAGSPVGRIWQHKSEYFEGFTKRYGVKRLVWFELYGDPQSAIAREKHLKEWQRAWKIRLIEETNPDWRDLYADIGGASVEWLPERP